VTTSPTEEAAPRSGGPGRAMVIGTGLIGGSVGMALRAHGWYVTGTDATSGTAARAVEDDTLVAVVSHVPHLTAAARRAGSAGAPRPEELVEVRIPVRDRPGALAERGHRCSISPVGPGR